MMKYVYKPSEIIVKNFHYFIIGLIFLFLVPPITFFLLSTTNSLSNGIINLLN